MTKWLLLTICYLPGTLKVLNFGNQKSGHFNHCYNPNPSPPPLPQTKMFLLCAHSVRMFFNKSIIPFTESLPVQLQQYRSCRKIHSYIWFRLIKEISSKFAEKRPGKILISVLNIILKPEIFTGWNSKTSGCLDFWRFWKSRIRTVLIKSRWLAGILASSAVISIWHFRSKIAGKRQRRGKLAPEILCHMEMTAEEATGILYWSSIYSQLVN